MKMLLLHLICALFFIDKVLKGKDVYKKEYEEARTLLKFMRKKYKMVLMKVAEEAAPVDLDGRMPNQE